MTKINRLPSEVVELIAAGEVAERPVIIIKELIENALDAHASSIEIELEQAGLQKIMVKDDGQGMSDDDLTVAYQRHTTSKINRADDLYHLTSFGFRGEALASIAQVGHLTLKSRPPSSTHGFQVLVNQLTASEPQPVGMTQGTVVIVKQLFEHLPVRKKFLKSVATELRLIVNLVTTIALAQSEVDFKLVNDGQVLLKIARHANLLERVSSLLAISDTSLLLPLASSESLQISGYIGTPQLARKTTAQQYLFVNQRPVTQPAMRKVIKTAFGTLIAPSAEPIFVMFLELDPNQVDVNVHPRKETVLFSDEAAVMKAVQSAVTTALQTYDITYAYDSSDRQLRDSTPTYDHSHFTNTKQSLRSAPTIWQPGKLEAEEIIQLHNTYLVLQSKTGALLIDQHAAHERILYEEFLRNIQTHVSTQQHQLESPVLLDLSATERLLLKEYRGDLHQLGFEIEEFGQQTVKISAVPTSLAGRKLATIFKHILDDLSENVTVTTVSHKVTAYLACRSAVKAGDFLTQDQRQSLVTKLMTTPNRYTCPHGRPTMISLELPELETMFKRRA